MANSLHKCKSKNVGLMLLSDTQILRLIYKYWNSACQLIYKFNLQIFEFRIFLSEVYVQIQLNKKNLFFKNLVLRRLLLSTFTNTLTLILSLLFSNSTLYYAYALLREILKSTSIIRCRSFNFFPCPKRIVTKRRAKNTLNVWKMAHKYPPFTFWSKNTLTFIFGSLIPLKLTA